MRELIRAGNHTDQFVTFTTILATQGISIARIWRGPSMRQAAVFHSNRLKTRYIHARDLSKKGGPARQLDYAERTASKALTAVRAKA